MIVNGSNVTLKFQKEFVPRRSKSATMFDREWPLRCHRIKVVLFVSSKRAVNVVDVNTTRKDNINNSALIEQNSSDKRSDGAMPISPQPTERLFQISRTEWDKKDDNAKRLFLLFSTITSCMLADTNMMSPSEA